VAQLKLAWTYRTGALQQQTELIRKAAFESTPILVENKLFLSTPLKLAHGAATETDWSGGYQVTSAPAIANGLVITRSSIADNWRVNTGRGIVRAFDARSGDLRPLSRQGWFPPRFLRLHGDCSGACHG
jgi:glucose dehydrogenase